MDGFQNILITSQKEFLETVRNRWLQGFIGIFVVLSLAISVISRLQSGTLDLDTIQRFDISLLNLTLLIVPLISMIVSSQNIVSEKADGFMELLSVYPIRWYQLILGKYMGMLFAFSASLLIGFGVTGLILAIFTQSLTFAAFLMILLVAIFLAGAFLAIGLVISSFSRSRGSATVASLFIWLFLEIIYDLGVIQVIVSMQGFMSQAVFNALIGLNPVDAARLTITHIMNLQIDVGTGNGVLDSVTPPSITFLVLCLLVWFIAPLLFCRRGLHLK